MGRGSHEKMLGMKSRLPWHTEGREASVALAQGKEHLCHAPIPSTASTSGTHCSSTLGRKGTLGNAPGGGSPTLLSPAPRNGQVCFSLFSSKMLRARGSFRECVRKQGTSTQPQLDIAAGLHWAQDDHGHPSR